MKNRSFILYFLACTFRISASPPLLPPPMLLAMVTKTMPLTTPHFMYSCSSQFSVFVDYVCVLSAECESMSATIAVRL